MNDKERQTGIMEGTEGILEDASGLAMLTDDDLENVTGGVTYAPFENAVGMDVYGYYNNNWWPGVIVSASVGDPPLYTVEGYNSNGKKWTLICTRSELRKR